MLFQVAIRQAEMMVTEEPPIGREGRWMGGSQHEMLAAIDESTFLLGIAAP